MTDDTPFKSGFVMLAGAPNAGKSTLLNRMLGEKIAITSDKPQTTRNRILGVLHRPSAQLVFLDTPGVHRAQKALNVRMVDTALAAIGDSDVVTLVADIASPSPEAEEVLISALGKGRRRPVILALNKIDRMKPEAVLVAIETWRGRYEFDAVVPISARLGVQVDVLLNEMESRLPEGPPFFPEDTLTDLPERFIVAEMVREKVFRLTGQEIPHATAVTVESFSESPDLVSIHATIHVERDSQKAIVIGKGGERLGRIGEAARKDIERMLGTRVFLKLFVRVQKNWSRDARSLARFGY